VQIALKQATVDAVGRDTTTGEPSFSVADFDAPTPTAATVVSRSPAAALGGCDGCELDGEQAARARAPAPAAEAVRTTRRVGCEGWVMIRPT
jgi:hypothetical protein